MGWVNSGLSMMTTASGTAATAAATVSRTRRTSRGSRARIDSGLITATSERGNSEVRPWLAIASPPTPA